ncbi:MAG TPA: TlpA disulfide reductase family protein [Terracidiphilus sp.]|nr:TlpA disulfide reductase family protein [Terracidiphilus sp.]
MSIVLENSASNALRIGELTLRLIAEASDQKPAILPLTSLAGRIVVLFVFGADCSTCKYLAGLLSEFHDEFKPDVEFIGVCVQSGCEERLEEFRATSNTRITLAYCPSREIRPALHIPPGTWLFYPTIIFIDEEQRMRGYFVGGSSFFENTAANLLGVLGQLLCKRWLEDAIETRERVEVRG